MLNLLLTVVTGGAYYVPVLFDLAFSVTLALTTPDQWTQENFNGLVHEAVTLGAIQEEVYDCTKDYSCI